MNSEDVFLRQFKLVVHDIVIERGSNPDNDEACQVPKDQRVLKKLLVWILPNSILEEKILPL